MRGKKAVAKTKIICTLGPASQSVEQLVALIQAGMDVARLNFSHGTHEDHLAAINNVREASRRTGEYITILQDLCGPKIRTGKLQNKSIELNTGAAFTFTIDEITGDEHRVTTTYRELPEDVQTGDIILLDDGRMSLRVVSKTAKDVQCVVVNGGILKENKGMNLPGIKLSTPSLTEKDLSLIHI